MDLKAEAKQYYELGFNVIAIKYGEGKGKIDKKPLCGWGSWHAQRQTPHEFENQSWEIADGFGIITDFPNNDGFYLGVVDYDVKNVDEEAREKGKQLISKFPTTQMEKTVSGGLHLVYLSKVKPKPVKDFHATSGLELIGGGLLCVMAPSKGYERLNDNPPLVVEDVEGLFYQILGVEDKRGKANEGLPNDLLEKWFRQILNSKTLKISGEGSNYLYCRCPLPTHGGPDVHPSFALSKKGFYGYCFKENKILNLKELAEALGIDLEAKAEGLPSVKPLFSTVWRRVHPSIDVINGTAYVGVNLPCEVTDKEGKKELKDFHFLVGSDRSLILCRKEELVKHKFQLAHIVVKLPNRWSFESVKAWLDGNVNVEPEQLYIAVKTALETYIEFEDGRVYDFLTLWVIGTYVFHCFNSYPYLYIGGMKQVGKTKLLTLLSLLCHNAIFSNNISTASAFRLVQSGRCTLLMDETEKLVNPEREIDFRNMLYSGYKKGVFVYRTHKDTLKPEPFEVYSPKAIANISGLTDILEDRCVVIFLKRGKNFDTVNREIPLDSPVWQQIRDKLYIFYLSCLNEFTEHTEFSHLLNRHVLKQRELELWKPILTLALFFNKFFNGLFEKIIEFAEEKAKEKETENRTENLDLILVKGLLSMVEKDDFYKVSEIRNVMAEYFDEQQNWLTTKWVGNALRRLGFTEKRRMKSYEYFLTLEKVKDLAERLGISQSSPSTKCESPLSSVSASILEVYDALRKQFKEPFYEGKAYDLIVKLRKCDLKEAEKLFQTLVDEGKVFRDAYGLWRWASGFSKENEKSLETEKRLENVGELVYRQSSVNSELPKGLIQCEFCLKQGRLMLFASRHDLELHVRGFHGGYPDSKPNYVR